MSDEQLTVAELLARAGRNATSEDKPKRRRRRSLEDGGVSVAELTGSIPRVKAAPVESRHSAIPIDAPAETEQAKSDDAEAVDAAAEGKTAEPTPVVDAPESVADGDVEEPAEEKEPTPVERMAAAKAAAKAKAEKRAEPTAEEEGEKPAPALPTSRETAVLRKVDEEPGGAEESADTGLLPAVGTDTAVAPAPEEPAEDTTPADEGDDGWSLGPVILMSLVGIVIGVLVFLGFDFLWDRLNRPLVAVLALAVTGAMVYAVRALRTTKDTLSMALAGAVGLLMTFGPLLITVL